MLPATSAFGAAAMVMWANVLANPDDIVRHVCFD